MAEFLFRERTFLKKGPRRDSSYTITAGAQDLIGEASLTSLTLSPQARKSLLQVVGLREVFLVDFCLLWLAVRAHSFLCVKPNKGSNIRKSHKQNEQGNKIERTICSQGGFATKAGGSLHSVFHEPANWGSGYRDSSRMITRWRKEKKKKKKKGWKKRRNFPFVACFVWKEVFWVLQSSVEALSPMIGSKILISGFESWFSR